MAYLCLVRHGQSTWNAVGAWTGLTNIGLDEKGKEEARQAGYTLKGMNFDEAYTSDLIRAQQTLKEILAVLGLQSIPIFRSAALNERDYGDLTGKNKWDVEKEYGKEQFESWRRGWDELVPGGETLEDVYARVVPYYKSHILPEIQSGKNILVSAHGNSLRALVKYLENISDEKIADLEIATGEVYVYEIDNDGKIIHKEIRAAHPVTV